MIAVIQGMQFPIEPNPEVEPIRIVAVVGDSDGWESSVEFTIDSGTNLLAINRDTWLKVFGELPSTTSSATAETADGRDANVMMAEVSLRLQTTDHQTVELHRVPCAILDGGTESLLPLTLLSLFRVTITQGRLSEMVLCPRRKIELAHIGE